MRTENFCFIKFNYPQKSPSKFPFASQPRIITFFLAELIIDRRLFMFLKIVLGLTSLLVIIGFFY